MRRPLAAVLVGLATCTLLTGCRPSGMPSRDLSKSTGPDPASLKTELTFWDTSDPTTQAPVFQTLVARFTREYPHVKVNYRSVAYEDAQRRFTAAAAAGSGAPQVLRAEISWVPRLASQGYLRALDGTAALTGHSFLKVPLASGVYRGATYGAPQVTDTLALMYNKRLFAEAGIDHPPTTWSEVGQVARKLGKLKDVQALYLAPTGYYLLPFIYGEGGDLLDTKHRTITVDDARSVAGVRTAQHLIRSGAAMQPDPNNPYGSMVTLFKTGRVAMIIDGPWEVRNIADAPDFGGLDNLGVAPVPGGPQEQGSPTGGHDYVLSSRMDRQQAQAAEALVGYLASAESEAYVAEKLGLLPGNADSYRLVDDPGISAWRSALRVMRPRPPVPQGALMLRPLDGAAADVLLRDKPVRPALQKVAAAYRKHVVPDYAR